MSAVEVEQLELFSEVGDVDTKPEPFTDDAVNLPPGQIEYHWTTGVGRYNRYGNCMDDPPAFLSNGEPDWCDATRNGTRCRAQRHGAIGHVFGYIRDPHTTERWKP
jgi:hypothetical protein